MLRIPQPKNIDVVILCGGKGRRLRSVVSDRPKPMAGFNGRPFLSMLMEYAASFGFRRFILCTGYLGEMIQAYYKERPEPWETVFCHEKSALGTGGAVKATRKYIHSSPFLVMNGDSFAAIDLKKFLSFHLGKKALLSIAVVKNSGSSNTGKLALDPSQRILSFEEKKNTTKNRFASTGIYLMDRQIFSFMKKNKKFSLEYDLFPGLLKEDCFGYKQRTTLIDFGTPQEYQKAQHLFSKGTVLKP